MRWSGYVWQLRRIGRCGSPRSCTTSTTLIHCTRLTELLNGKLPQAWTARRGGITITDTGIQTLGSWEPLPTGSALIDYWRSRLGKAERLILETLTQAHPDALTKEDVASNAG